MAFSLVDLVSKVLCNEHRQPTHADTTLAPNGTIVGETRTLKKKVCEVVVSTWGIYLLTARRLDIWSP